MAKGLSPVFLAQPPTLPEHATRKDYVDARAVPAGGTAGQILAKNSALDRDLKWIDPPTGGGGGGGTSTLRGALDYDDTTAPTDNQGILWSSSGGKFRPTSLTASLVGADPAGTGAAQRSAHEGSSDPHTQYLTNARGDARYSALGHAHSASDITSGVLAYARLPVGSAASTVAAGNDARFNADGVLAPPPSGGDDLAALQAAQPTRGRLILRTGTYLISDRLTVGYGQDIAGQGGNLAGSATTIKCTAAGAGVDITSVGGISGNFNVDGNNVATAPFKRLPGGGAAQRTFINLSVVNSAQDNILILAAQNDTWVGCNAQYAGRDNIVLDQGAGGNAFLRCEFNGATRYQLRFDVQAGPGPDGYNTPIDNTFHHCILEREHPSGGGVSSVYIAPNCPVDHLVFDYCSFFANPAATGPRIDNQAVGSQIWINGGRIQGTSSTNGGTGLRTVDGATIRINGSPRFEGLQYGIFLVSGNPQINVSGYIAWSSVGTRIGGNANTYPDTSVKNYQNQPLEIFRQNITDRAIAVYREGDSGIRFLLSADGTVGLNDGVGYTPKASLYSTAQGVLGQPAAQVWQLGRGATGSRPAAVLGGAWWDTSLSRPVFSDGSVWTAGVLETDARLSNARTPTTHASTHASGGSDPVSPAAIGASPSTHGHDTTPATNTVVQPNYALYQPAHSPTPKILWHDLLRFNIHYNAPTVETSPDGTTWTTSANANLISELFAGKQAVSIPVTSGSGQRVRWTWQKSTIPYSFPAWFCLAFLYDANASKTVTIEGSTNGTSWRTIHTATGIWNTTPTWHWLGGWDTAGVYDSSYLRLTIIQNGTTGLSLSGIQLLTQRDDGYASGVEGEYPYAWDGSRRMAIGGAVDTSSQLRVYGTLTATNFVGTLPAHAHSGADITSGTVGYARLPVGTAASTVAAGDDVRFTNSRTPTAHAASHASNGSDPITPASLGAVPSTRTLGVGTGLTGGGDLSADRSFSVLYGTAAGTAAQGNDSRLSDSRTPTTHAASHARAGSDPITPQSIGAAQGTTPVSKNADYQAAVGELVLMDASGGPRTVTGPTITADGQRFAVKKVDTSTNVVTVAAASGNTIGSLGAASIPIRDPDQAGTYQAWGTNWVIPHGYHSLTALTARFAAASHSHAAGDITSGVFDIARIPTGATGTTVALGNDSRFTDARTPIAHAASHAPGAADDLSTNYLNLTGTQTVTGQKTVPAGAGNSWIFNQPPQVALGTAANHPVRRDDARLTDSRTPTTHASTHLAGGSDAIASLVPAGGTAGQVLTKSGSADYSMAWAAAPGGGGGLGGVVDCSAMTTAAAINTASASAGDGSIIWLGRRSSTAPLVLEDTLILRPYQKLLGAGGRAQLTCIQAGASFTAGKPLLAAQGYLNNQSAADNPISVVGVHLDANTKTGSHGLVVYNYWSHFEDVQITKCDGAAAHGIHATDGAVNGTTKSLNSHSENTFKRCRFMSFTNRASMFWAECTNGQNNSNQDGHLQDCFFAGTVTTNVGAQGGFGIRITRAAGWTIDNNHLYGIGQDAINLDNCYATKVTHNYVEDFGGENASSPGAPTYGYYNGISLNSVLDGRPSIVIGNKVSVTPPESGTWTGNRWTCFYARAGASQTKAYLIMSGNSAVYTQGTPPSTLKNYAYQLGEGGESGKVLNVEWSGNQIGQPLSTWWAQQRLVDLATVNLNEVPQMGARSHGGSWEADIFGDLMSNGARDDATSTLAMSSTIRTMILTLGWLPAGRYTGVRMFLTTAMVAGSASAALVGSTSRTATSWAQIGSTATPVLNAGLLSVAVTNFVLTVPQFVMLELVLTSAPSTYPVFSATPAGQASLINPPSGAPVAGSSSGTSVVVPLNPTTGFTNLTQKAWVSVY